MADKTEVQSALEAVEGNYVSDSIPMQDGSIVTFYSGGEHGMRTLVDNPLTPKLPAYISQLVPFGSLVSLVDYSLIYKNETSRAFLHAETQKFVVHFDYHKAGNGQNFDKHIASFKPIRHPDYEKWRLVLGEPIDQETYAEFIEDMMHTIASPSAALLLDAIKEFEIGTEIRFKKVLNDRTGSASIVYVQEDREMTTELPRDVVLVMPLFLGSGEVSIEAKVSYRAHSGELKFVIKAPGLDKLERDQIDMMADDFVNRSTIPLYVVP